MDANFLIQLVKGLILRYLLSHLQLFSRELSSVGHDDHAGDVLDLLLLHLRDLLDRHLAGHWLVVGPHELASLRLLQADLQLLSTLLIVRGLRQDLLLRFNEDLGIDTQRGEDGTWGLMCPALHRLEHALHLHCILLLLLVFHQLASLRAH